jgi:hypothetical protein
MRDSCTTQCITDQKISIVAVSGPTSCAHCATRAAVVVVRPDVHTNVVAHALFRSHTLASASLADLACKQDQGCRARMWLGLGEHLKLPCILMSSTRAEHVTCQEHKTSPVLAYEGQLAKAYLPLACMVSHSCKSGKHNKNSVHACGQACTQHSRQQGSASCCETGEQLQEQCCRSNTDSTSLIQLHSQSTIGGVAFEVHTGAQAVRSAFAALLQQLA